MTDMLVSVRDELIATTWAAYHQLVNDEDADKVYAALTAFYATHGLDADVAESSIDWAEGGTLAESLEYELDRLPIVGNDESEEPCDCADFAGCSDCREWAENMLADGCSPWNGLPISPGEYVAPLPPWD